MKIKIGLLAMAMMVSTSASAKVPGPLVSTDWLSKNTKNVVMLDIRKDTPSYSDKGHIPGANLVAYKKLNGKMTVNGVTLKQMVPSADAFSALMNKSGVKNDSSIVIISRGEKPDHVFQATRLYWVFKYFGHNDVAILNGGTAQWAKEKRPMSKDFADDVAGTYKAGAAHDEIRATTDQVAMASKDGSSMIYDARGLDQYVGLRYKKGFVKTAGRVPNAHLATSSIFLAKKGPKTFESIDKIKATLVALKADGPAMAYCNSGQYSSALWFMMHELAGNKKAKLYDGSMHAWTQTGHNTSQ